MAAAKKKLVLVDGHWLIFRAYFAIPGNFTTSAGLHTNATYGFALMFQKLFAGRTPELGAVCFDPPGPTHRDLRYPAYKGDREPMRDDLIEQLPAIDEVVQVNGFPILRAPGYEADDVIGTLATRGEQAGMEVTIVAGDKDFAQLITDNVRMFDPMRDAGGVTYDPELVRKKWGVRPDQIVDLLAMMGDKVDCIPGVPGIGAKGAGQLLERYGSLTEILAHADELKPRQQKALTEHRDLALLSQELATIDKDVPGLPPLDELVVSPPGSDALNGLYRRLEFYSFLTEDQETAARADAGQETTVGVLTEQAEVEKLLARARKFGPAAIAPLYDPPTCVANPVVGFALSIAGEAPSYLPLAGKGETLDQGAREALVEYLADPAAEKIAHGAKYVAIALLQLTDDTRALAGVVGDTQLGSFLVDAEKLIPHGLDAVAKHFLQRPMPPLKRITGAGKKLVAVADVEVGEAAQYAGQLAAAVTEIWPKQAATLRERGDQLAHLREHDLELAWVLARMERRGILIDVPHLEALEEAFATEKASEEAVVYGLAGRTFNIASTKQLADVLFGYLGLPVIKKTKTGYSTNQEVLEVLAQKPGGEIAGHLLRVRTLAKLINTYTDVLRKAVNPATGRVHADFQQTTGVSGRLISTDPDLQRTPVKTPEGKRIREAFVAPSGWSIISADWSQIELRIMAHVTGDERLLAAFHAGHDVHRQTAATLFDTPLAEVTGAQRTVGKTINFATIYGQGATALSQILGIARKEAKQYIDDFFRLFSGVREWRTRMIDEASAAGYVETLLGRRRYIHELSSHNSQDRAFGERVACNTPIQGSAADICKTAMLQIDRRLRGEGLAARMLLQIHDELVFEAPAAELARVTEIVRYEMEHVLDLAIPLTVDLGHGPTWAAAH